MALDLLVPEIQDEYSQENFQRLLDFVRSHPILSGEFTVREITFLRAETNFRYRHGMEILPKDVILTSITGAGALTINYALFTSEFLDFTTSGACKVRLLIGQAGRV